MAEETNFTVHSSPLKVWSLLADVAGYALWHPHYRFAFPRMRKGDGIVTWNFSSDFHVRMPFYLEGAEKPGLWTWWAGRPGLLRFEERYEITPLTNGAAICHRFVSRGLVGRIFDRVMREEVRAHMAEQDAALADRLKVMGRSPGLPKSPGRR